MGEEPAIVAERLAEQPLAPVEAHIPDAPEGLLLCRALAQRGYSFSFSCGGLSTQSHKPKRVACGARGTRGVLCGLLVWPIPSRSEVRGVNGV